MRDRLETLLDLISSKEESVILKRIISENSFPFLLKIAQEQLSLFDTEKEVEDKEEEYNKPDFSFKSMIGQSGLDEEGAIFLDSLLEMMLDKFPEKNEIDILNEIKKDLIVGNYPDFYYNGDWISRNESKLKKYISMFPDLAWKPEEHQLSIPYKEIPTKIPLGWNKEQLSSFRQVEEKVNIIRDEILNKEEYKKIKENTKDAYWDSGLYNSIGSANKELRERLEKENIPWSNSYSFNRNRSKLNESIESSHVISKKKEKIEAIWHEVKKKNDIILNELKWFEDKNYEYNIPFDREVTKYKDCMESILDFTLLTAKSYIPKVLNYAPLSAKKWGEPSYVVDDIDFSDLKNLLEFSNKNVSPSDEFSSKIAKIELKDLYCDAILYNVKKWRFIFSRIDKSVKKEVEMKISYLAPDDIKLLRWIEKIRPEYISNVHKKYIEMISSNLVTLISENQRNNNRSVDIDIRFVFSDIFMKKGTFKSTVKQISDDIFSCFNSLKKEIVDDIYKDLKKYVFNSAKEKFEKKYFNYPIIMSESGEFYPTYSEEKLPIEKVIEFINEWNGTPNLKSYVNVILNSTKDPNFLSDFYKIVLSEDVKFLTFAENIEIISPYIFSFLIKMKTKDNKEIFELAEKELVPFYLERMKKSLAQAISYSFSCKNTHQFSSTNKDGEANISSLLWRPILKSFDEPNIRSLLNRVNSYNSTKETCLFLIAINLEQSIEKLVSIYGLNSFLYESMPNYNQLKDASEKFKNISDDLHSIRERYRDETTIPFLEFKEKLKKSIEQIIVVTKMQNDESSTNYLQNIINLMDEMERISKLSRFITRSYVVSTAFNGVGYKDISSGIENLFSRENILGVSKKEFINIISNFVSPTGKEISQQESDEITAFLQTISSLVFYNYTSKFIKKLNIRDTKKIISISILVGKLSLNNNMNLKDLEKVMKILPMENVSEEVAVTRWIKAAAFHHNHSSIPINYIKNIIQSPSFYSDTTISKTFIETCAKLYTAGGVNELKDPNTTKGAIAKKLYDVGLISDMNELFRTLNSFSRLCANKNGIRPNIGNGTAEIKLNDLIEEEDPYALTQSVFTKINLKEIILKIPGWNKLSFDERVSSLREKLSEEEAITDESMAIFDEKIKKIIESASSKEEYEQGIKVKAIIQSASSILKLIEDSETMITYSKDAKKKDSRIFNFQWTDPDSPFRFRVLKDLDPYHFSVGAETNCCQRIGGVGEAAAIDSFINPLAGVLVFEFKLNGEWILLSQSYFHYITSSNGLILDNVEINPMNLSVAREKSRVDINDYYAAFAKYIAETNKLSYVKCGTGYNKLSNESFKKVKMQGKDPRHFESDSKYSDFTMSSHIDLLDPKFDIKVNLLDKKAISINNKLLKLSSKVPDFFHRDLILNLCNYYC